jgi:hypothetical protein
VRFQAISLADKLQQDSISREEGIREPNLQMITKLAVSAQCIYRINEQVLHAPVCTLVQFQVRVQQESTVVSPQQQMNACTHLVTIYYFTHLCGPTKHEVLFHLRITAWRPLLVSHPVLLLFAASDHTYPGTCPAQCKATLQQPAPSQRTCTSQYISHKEQNLTRHYS